MSLGMPPIVIWRDAATSPPPSTLEPIAMAGKDQPGDCGAAIRLPYWPGSQKPTPPSSARASLGVSSAAQTMASAQADALREGSVMESSRELCVNAGNVRSGVTRIGEWGG